MICYSRQYWQAAFRTFLALVLIFNSFNLTAQTTTENLAKYFSLLRDNQQFNGNVLVVEKGKLVYKQSFGFADFFNKKRNNPDTRFPIASISKTLVATAILQLSDKGKLKPSDPAAKYLSQFPYPGVTIKHLLSHSSGLPPYNSYFDSVRLRNPGLKFTNADFLKGINENFKPLIYQPGAESNYDNINYIVLALVIEKIAGVSFPEYIEKNILKPANMLQTRFFPVSSQYAGEIKFPFAYPHLFPHRYSDSIVKAREVPYIVEYWSAYNFSGFGDYVSTLDDLLNFDKAYYDGRLLPNDLLNEVFTPVKLTGEMNRTGNFGLGWQVERDTTWGKIVLHGGGSTGLSCILLRNISRRQTIILFDNTHDNAYRVAMNALKVLNGVSTAAPRKSIVREYARVLLSDGAAAAREKLFALQNDSLNYQLDEDEMNSLGYDFMGGVNNPNPFHFPEIPKIPEAYETFKLNVELFPKSWNVYDSYGEILLKMGKKDEAIRMYKKSMELNPKNENGRKVLQDLETH